MTKTIGVSQEIVDSLSAGEHIFSVVAESVDGFVTTESQSFWAVGFPAISVESDFGSKSEGFEFNITLSSINDNAVVIGKIDGKQFYQLNYAFSGVYTVRVSDNSVLALSGGEHIITFELVDARGKTASSLSTFTKIYSVPVVSVASNVGDKKSNFALPFTIRNAKSEHPALAAYLDSTVTPIFQTDDASAITSITVDVSEIEAGTHSIILAVTNEAGTTTKNTAFNLVTDDKTYTGLKLGYFDDTWDGTVLENRIYTETEVTYAGQTYKSYEDKTPYDTEGEVVTGGLLAAMSRGVLNAGASTLTRNSDGSYTEISANGVSNLARTEDGYVEVYTDKVGNVLTKNVYINTDGSVSESTTYERA